MTKLGTKIIEIQEKLRSRVDADVYLRQCDVREPLEGEFGFLAGFSVSLSPENPRGRHGAESHPVPDEQDHVPAPRSC